MSYTIQSLNTSLPKTLCFQGKEIQTGFIKKPVNSPVFLTWSGFEGDGQADRKNHGGKDKAVLFYAHSHYAFWKKRYSRSFSLPSFGENITVNGITEKEVCIGDVFQIGEAVVQVCQPRNPCYKIAAFHQLQDIPSVVTETGYSGFYARVIKEGKVALDSKLILLKKGENMLRIAEVFRTLFSSADAEMVNQILASEHAAESLKKNVRKKAAKLEL